VAREPDAWSAPYRVRFDEAGPDGLLRTSVLLRYAQDVAWHHSTVRGYDRAWYWERGLAWLVRAARVTVDLPAAVGTELVGTTKVVGWRRVWARRGTEFRDATGALVATAQIDWVLLDARGAPTRIPAEFEPVFGAANGRLGLARVDLGAVPADARQIHFAVRPQELDPMAHVNNAVYADWLEEAVAQADGDAACRAIPREARLDYAAPADAGARLTGQVWPSASGWSYLLRDSTGQELLRARLEAIPPVANPT
jgi:acyl-CoA thioesterase FadM